MELEGKIDLILEKVSKIDVNVGKMEVRLDYLEKNSAIHEEKIQNIEATRHKMIGIFSLISLAATAFFTWLFKHF